MGRGGMPAIGERELRLHPASMERLNAPPPPGGWRGDGRAPLAPREFYFDGLPDVLGEDSASFLPRAPSRHVTLAVVGGGYGAAVTVRAILELAASRGNLYQFHVHWLLRSPRAAGAPYAPLDDADKSLLPARANLIDLANSMAEARTGGGGGGAYGDKAGAPHVTVHRGCSIDTVHRIAGGKLVVGGTRESEADEMEPFTLEMDTFVAQCGYKPSFELASEMRVQLDPTLDTVIDPTRPAAGEQPGERALETVQMVEPFFWTLGAKAYGRDARFLLREGIAQVAAVVEMLQVELLGATFQEEEAATRLQASIRGRAVRVKKATEEKEAKEEADAAARVQASIRDRQEREKAEQEAAAEAAEAEPGAATEGEGVADSSAEGPAAAGSPKAASKAATAKATPRQSPEPAAGP